MITLVAGSGGDLAMPPIDLADGGALWSHQQGALPPSAGAIRGLWASSGTDVYAVGTATAGVNAFHSTNHGVQWTPQLAGGTVDLNAVGGTSSTDVYLVGDNATILHGSGTSWTTQTSPAPAGTRLLAFWAIAPMDLYIAGGGNTIMHSGAGGGWVTQTVVGTTELRGVWGVAGHLWAVGSGGTILKSTGNGNWPPETSGTPNELRAVFGTSATDVWVVGDGVVLHSDGGGTWTAAADGVPDRRRTCARSAAARAGRCGPSATPGPSCAARRQRLGGRADRPRRRRSRRRSCCRRSSPPRRPRSSPAAPARRSCIALSATPPRQLYRRRYSCAAASARPRRCRRLRHGSC